MIARTASDRLGRRQVAMRRADRPFASILARRLPSAGPLRHRRRAICAIGASRLLERSVIAEKGSPHDRCDLLIARIIGIWRSARWSAMLSQLDETRSRRSIRSTSPIASIVQHSSRALERRHSASAESRADRLGCTSAQAMRSIAWIRCRRLLVSLIRAIGRRRERNGGARYLLERAGNLLSRRASAGRSTQPARRAEEL